MAVDPHRIGEFRIGYSRIGVLNPLFEGWIAQKQTVEVTRRRRIVSLVSDVYTGHPVISWEESTIDAILKFNVSTTNDYGAGGIGVLDGTIQCVDPLFHLDQFDYQGERFEIMHPPRLVWGRDGGFLHRKAAFRRIELEEP